MNAPAVRDDYPVCLGPLFELQDRVAQWMPTELTFGDIAEVLRRYDAAVRPNFLPWMLVALIRHPALQRLYKAAHWPNEPSVMSLGNLLGHTDHKEGDCDTTFGQKAAYIATYLNLDDETEVSERQNDAHPVMLYKFLTPNGGNLLADSRHTIFVNETVEPIYRYVGHKEPGATHHSALPALVVAAALELTSQVFIPILAKWMSALVLNPDLTYTDVHGEADFKHADLLLKAVAECYTIEEASREIIDEGVRLVEELLKQIFLAWTEIPRS